MDKFNLKKYLAEGKLLKESLQQLTPEEKSLLKDILEEKVESYEFGIDRYEVFIKDPNSKIHKDEIEEMKNNSEIVKNILNRL